MRIIEVRDNYIKFETNKKVALSSFIQVTEGADSIIAQVFQVKQAGEISIAYAKMLFCYNGELYDYDGTLPSINSEICTFDFNLINKKFESKNKIVVGNFIENNELIYSDKESFNKKTLICMDSPEKVVTVVSNLAKQYKKSLIIDMSGTINLQKFVAGIDFKLPLNTESLQFIFEDCLNDATADSKDLIKDIFQDLAMYSKTVSFVPFEALKNIVDEMVDKQHVFKLLVLKNKLAKFAKLGYFASTISEVENLNKIIDSEHGVVDLSKLDSIFQNQYLSIILSQIQTKKIETQVFTQVSNRISKLNLKKIITEGMNACLIVQSGFRYINDIKTMFNNFMIEPSFANNQTFKAYNMLSIMPKDACLLIIESFGSIPLVSKVVELKELPIFEDKVAELQDENSDLETVLDTIGTEVEEENFEEVVENSEESIMEEIVYIDEEKSLEAISKKSEDMIERVSEEVSAGEEGFSNLNLFEDDSLEDEITQTGAEDDILGLEETFEDNVVEAFSEEFLQGTGVDDIDEVEHFVNVVAEDESVEELSETSLEQVVEESVDSVENQIEEFHTQVDETQAVEIPSELLVDADEVDMIQDESEQDFETIKMESAEVSDLVEDSDDISILESSFETDIEELEDDIEIPEKFESNSFSELIPDEISLKAPSDEISFYEDVEAEDLSEDDDFGAIVELEDSSNVDADIVIELDESIESDSVEDIDRAIVEDVDKVFTTMKDDTISDLDLDFIDELNNTMEESDIEEEEIVLSDGMEELADFAGDEDSEDSFLEPLEEVHDFSREIDENREILEKRNASTPIVPVYGAEIPAEDMVMSDQIEQGDTVSHAKYGNGVVEKMIKYGTKTLASINFDTAGRKLLDPTLTEIKKY